MVPVICHRESMTEVKPLFETFDKHPCVSQLAHATVSREACTAFGLQVATNTDALKGMVNTGIIETFRMVAFYGSYKSSIPHADWLLPGAFLIDNGQVTSTERFAFEGVPDLVKMVEDMLKSADGVAACASECSIALKPFVPKLEKQKLTMRVQRRAATSLNCTPTASPKQKPAEVKIDLETVLANPKAFFAFKIHMTKEYSPESLLFIEQVGKYMAMSDVNDRRAKADQIIVNFFDHSSLLGLNVTTAMSAAVCDRLQQQGPVTDLFTPVVDDLKLTVLRDSFARFKTTTACANVVKGI